MDYAKLRDEAGVQVVVIRGGYGTRSDTRANAHYRFAREADLYILPYWFIDRRFDGAAQGREFAEFVNSYAWGNKSGKPVFIPDLNITLTNDDATALFDVEHVKISDGAGGQIDVTPTKAQVLAAYDAFNQHSDVQSGNYTGSYAWKSIMDGHDPQQNGVTRTLWFADWEGPDGHVREAKIPLPFVSSNLFMVQELARKLTGYNRPLDFNLIVGAPTKLPSPQTYDMRRYLFGDGTIAEMLHVGPDGNQHGHRVQMQFDPEHDNVRILTKGDDVSAEVEYMAITSDGIYRGLDTSQGNHAMYAPWQDDKPWALWILLLWSVGQIFEGAGHFVQRYWKRSGKEIAANSGPATNRIWFKAAHETHAVKHPTDPNAPDIVFTDVIELVAIHHDGELGESWFFASQQFVETQHGRRWWGGGMVQWGAPEGYGVSGYSAIVEIHAPGQRPDNTIEVVGGMDRFAWTN